MITLINTCLSTFRSARSGTCWFKRNHLPSQSPQCKPTCGWPISGGALQIMYCVRRHDFCRLGVLCSLRKVYFAVSDWFYHLMMTQSQCKIWAESETKSNFNFRALRQIGVLEFQQLVIVFVSIVNVGAYPVVMNDLNLNDLKGMLFQFSQFPRRICSLCPHCQSLAYDRKLLAATNTLWITVLCLAARSVTLELQDGLEPVRKLCPQPRLGYRCNCPLSKSSPFTSVFHQPEEANAVAVTWRGWVVLSQSQKAPVFRTKLGAWLPQQSVELPSVRSVTDQVEISFCVPCCGKSIFLMKDSEGLYRRWWKLLVRNESKLKC